MKDLFKNNKKMVYVILGVIAWCIFALTKQNDPLPIKEEEPRKQDTVKIGLNEQIKNSINDIDTIDLIKNAQLRPEQIGACVGFFNFYADRVIQGKASKDKNTITLAVTLESKLVAFQKHNFPKLRRQYYQYIKNLLWQNDIYINLSGKNNSILSLTGSVYAANKNIKETQEALTEMLNMLRFKQTRYTWYKGQEEYTYYDIKTPNDSEIMRNYDK